MDKTMKKQDTGAPPRGRQAKKRPAEGSSAGRQAKQSRNADPRLVAPHSLTLQTFRLKFPFVKVYQKMSYTTGLKDRCGPEFLMKAETMSAFINFLGGPSLRRGLSAFETTGGEISTAPVHFTLFSALHALARALAVIRRREKKEAEGANDDADHDDMHWEVKEKEELPSHYHKEGEDEDAASVKSAGSSSSHEEAIFQAEASYRNVSGGTGFGDIVAKAYDSAFLRKCNLTSAQPSALITLLVFELKADSNLREVWREGPGGGYQAADCALHHAFKNLEVGRKHPIWLLTQSRSFWSYGCLAVDGIVNVLPDGQEEMDEEDRIVLEARTRELSSFMNEACFYPQGKYIKGRLYISEEVLDAPHEAMLTSDSWRYFESLLRICLGDRVLAWTKADVDKLIAEVYSIEQLESEHLFGGISDSQLEVWRSLTKRLKSK